MDVPQCSNGTWVAFPIGVGVIAEGPTAWRPAPQNGGMPPAIVLSGVVALSLLVLGATMYPTAREPRRQTLPFRRDVPWIIGGVLAVGGVLVVIPAVPSIVVVGVMAYTGIAATAIWRMASLDEASPWIAQSRRLARFGIAALALTWLGLVFGLLLWIADMVAHAR